MTAPQTPGHPAGEQPLDPWGQPITDPWAPAPGRRRAGSVPAPGPSAPPAQSSPGTLGAPLENDRRRLSGVRATGGSFPRALQMLFGGKHRATQVSQFAAGVQAPVTTGRRIAVVSTRGGAGKTTASALLARTFSALRPDSVCVLDLDPGHGSLALRLGLDQAPSLDSIVPELTNGAQPGAAHLAGLLAPAAEGLYATGPRSGSAQRTGAPLLREAASTVSRYFPITLLDCPTGLQAPETQAALADCHGALFMVPATLSGLDDALAALSRWRANPLLSGLPLTVLVMQQDRSSALQALDQAGRLSRLGFDAHAIGYDRHLAAGALITLPLMLPAHREAATALAARSLELANGVR
ncbi:MAG: nucleotide-binding protein [Arthrobacter sp.]|uniref:nucleotide-binding protein n=1 Tax=Arthrobacter TaxID=1663 RepID=UPI00265517BA|nr:hypothetical protein [Micrococcaceae bacterium]MDN5887662.1 hypothetical protein [Micrococcaceae bacterium]MDN5905814.1 hypothetical protein [Micrococcaceae bacterium]